MGNTNSKLERNYFLDQDRVITEESQRKNQVKSIVPTSSDTSAGISIHGPTEAQIIAPMQIRGKNNTVYINSSPPSTPSLDRIEFNIQGCVPSFFGRDEFIKKLHEDIEQSPKENTSPIRSKAIVICGLPGVGKTQVVRRYIQEYKESYNHVLWISAESNSVATSSFLRLAKKLRLSITHDGQQKDDEEILDEVYDFVCQKFALIVFDNVGTFKSVDGKDGLHLLLPQTLKTGWKVPAIIVTTRNRDWLHFIFRELPGFDLNEGLSFLSALNFEDTEENRQLLQQVTEMCQGLPLALQQVISFVRIKRDKRAALGEGPYTLKDFVNDVTSKKRKKFISTKPPESAYLDVYTLFELTFEQIGSMDYGELALQCIDVMSILNPDCIPTALIKQFFCQTKRKLLAKALSLLHKYTLVTRYDKYYQIHRMVQTAKIEATNEDGSSFVKHNFNEILDSLTTFLDNLPINFENLHEILNNSIRLHDQADIHSERLLKFQIALAHKLRDTGNYRAAIQLHRKTFQSNYELWGAHHVKTITSKADLGYALVLQGLNEEAHELYNDVQKIQINTLGLHHPSILVIKRNLALVCHRLGKTHAQELYNDVQKTEVRVFGPNHLFTLNTINNLASCYFDEGKYDKAQELYSHFLKMLIQRVGPDHPKSLVTKSMLAAIFNKQGEHNKAKKLCNDVLNKQINQLGPDHPETLYTKHTLASLFQLKGKYKKAQKLFEDVLQNQINFLGSDHRTTLVSKLNLAHNYFLQEKYDKAEELTKDVLKIQITILGSDHSDTVETKIILAKVYYVQGKYNEAQELFSEVLKIRMDIFGPDHPYTVITQNSLDLVLHAKANMAYRN